MRYLTLAVFLTLIMGFAGCGDTGDMGNMGDTGEAATSGDGAMQEMTMEAPADEAPMMEAPDDGPPQWQVLEQNVVHSE